MKYPPWLAVLWTLFAFHKVCEKFSVLSAKGGFVLLGTHCAPLKCRENGIISHKQQPS